MKRSRNSPQPQPQPPLHYSSIPFEFLLQMGSSEINLHGTNLTVHVIDSSSAVDKHITDLRRYLECNTKVVGLDLKMKVKPEGGSYRYHSKPNVLVLCVFRRCLVIHLEECGLFCKAPQSLEDFLYDPKICFVGATTLPKLRFSEYSTRYLDVGVKVGDLAARVMRKPALTALSLGDVAKEVGVPYHGGIAYEIVVDSSNNTSDGDVVLTDEQIKGVVSEAYAYYQIGYKLLTSL